MKTVLVTGGAGYVGSHCCKAFANAGWNVVVYDDLSRGWREAVRWGPLIEGSLLNRSAITMALKTTQPDLVAHFAAFAYVGESVDEPGLYYRNNSVGTLNLLDAMRDTGTDALLFSSTCATYGLPVQLPIAEDHPQNPINPYGWSKLIVERMLEDYGRAHGMRSVALRYFNAGGCDPEGELGEHHLPETHAIPLAIMAALRPDLPFSVYGADFDTRDGSAIRDYIHVTDLARAHLLAGEHLITHSGNHVFNLGTGIGTSVLELVAAVERVVGTAPRVQFGPRRVGDPAELVASFAKAQDELGWTPELSSIDTIVSTALAGQARLIK
jgi:UDP-arabinose 4-epimerase